MPIFLGLLYHLNQIFKIKKSIYIHELEVEECENAWSPWNGFINHLAALDVA